MARATKKVYVTCTPELYGELDAVREDLQESTPHMNVTLTGTTRYLVKLGLEQHAKTNTSQDVNPSS